MKKPIKTKIRQRQSDRINRREQIENLSTKGYFSRPKRAFTTKRIVWGNIDKVPTETLRGIYKIMLARIKTKQALREKGRNEQKQAKKINQEKQNKNKRIGQRIMKKATETNLTDSDALQKYNSFIEVQRTKLAGIESRSKKRLDTVTASSRRTKKSTRIFEKKGKGDTVIINLGGVPIAFRITRQNIAEIENRIWPQTKLDPIKIAIRRIVIKYPGRKIRTIIKNLEAQKMKATREEVAEVITEMINEKLIERGYPVTPNKK